MRHLNFQNLLNSKCLTNIQIGGTLTKQIMGQVLIDQVQKPDNQDLLSGQLLYINLYDTCLYILSNITIIWATGYQKPVLARVTKHKLLKQAIIVFHDLVY